MLFWQVLVFVGFDLYKKEFKRWKNNCVKGEEYIVYFIRMRKKNLRMVNGLKAIALDENSRNERKADQNDATDNISIQWILIIKNLLLSLPTAIVLIEFHNWINLMNHRFYW